MRKINSFFIHFFLQMIQAVEPLDLCNLSDNDVMEVDDATRSLIGEVWINV